MLSSFVLAIIAAGFAYLFKGGRKYFVVASVLFSFMAVVAFTNRPTPTIAIGVTSDPTGASVLVEGREAGRTPVTINVPVDTPTNYSVIAEEPYEYRLFKPFSGTLTVSEPQNVSVWIERTTTEEQQAEIQAAEEAQRRRAEEAERRAREAEERRRAAQARREAELEARKVYYRIETNCARGADLTYSNKDGNSTQQSNQGNGWYYWFYPRDGQFVYLSAQNQCDYGYITVKVVQNNKVLEQNTSSGAYVIATVSGRW